MKQIFESIAEFIEKVEFKPHDVVFKDGDTSRDMYFILEGKVQIVKAISGGGHKILATLQEGDIFGEGALLTDDPRGASAQAVTDVKAYKLSLDVFKKLLVENPAKIADMLMKIIEVVNGRLQYVNSELITLYSVTRILSNSPDDLRMVTHDVLKKFMEISSAEEGAIFLHNLAVGKEDLLAVSDDSGADFMAKITSEVQDKAKDFSENPNSRYDLKDANVLWLPIRSFEGKFMGLVVLGNAEGEFTSDEIKLAIAVTEQLGTAVERHYSKESDKERVRLKQQMVSGL